VVPRNRTLTYIAFKFSRIDPTDSELPTVQVCTSTDILSDTDQEMASETAHGIREVPYIQELQPFRCKVDIQFCQFIFIQSTTQTYLYRLHSISFNMSVTTTQTFQHIPSSITLDYGSVPPAFTQHPLQRRHGEFYTCTSCSQITYLKLYQLVVAQ